MLGMNKKGFVEVWDATKGNDAAVVEALVENGMDVKYKELSTGYTYYRVRATKKEVKAFSNQLEALGYFATLHDNKYFHIVYRVQ